MRKIKAKSNLCNPEHFCTFSCVSIDLLKRSCLHIHMDNNDISSILTENKNIKHTTSEVSSYLWFTFLCFIVVIFQLLLCEEFFLAIKALEDFFHVYEHVFLQRLSVDKHLTAVVAEHAGIQEVVVLHLEMFLHFRQFLEVLTAPVAAK